MLLQVYSFVLLVIPSDVTLGKISGALFPAGIIGMLAFGWWMAAILFGLHDPRNYPNPARLSFFVLWACSLISYAFLAITVSLPVEVRAGDRWLIQLCAWTGVAMVAAESLNSMRDFHAVIRALVWGGAVCGFVASLQFWVNLDLAVYLRWIPGFSLNAENLGIDSRASLNRVAGTAIHPIELGVVAATVLPLAIFNGLYDKDRSPARRSIPVVLIIAAIPVSVSRSAILAAVVSLGLLLASLKARQRTFGLLAIPVAVAAFFLTAPGLIGTFRDFFGQGTNEPSAAARQKDIPLVEKLVREHPWFGRGGGSYAPVNPLDNLDNQYYRMLIELGIVGTVLITAAYLIAPAVIAFVARKRCTSESSRTLGAALGGSAAASALVAFTFDSLGFPMYAGLIALIIGMIGAYWRLARAEERSAHDPAAGAPAPLCPIPPRTR